MKNVFFAVVLIISATLLCSCNNTQSSSSETSNNNDTTANEKNYGGYASQVEYGKHLVAVIGCNDCHTPKKMTPQGPVPDTTLTLSGHPHSMPAPDVNRKEIESKGLALTNDMTSWVGPWGISYADNITSDETGIGNWTEQQFMRCIREGKWKGLEGNRQLLPPMPWQDFAQMKDEELKAIFAYLKSTKPVKNVVPAAQPPVTAMNGH